MKKMMLLALAVASVAMFALPAMASAGTWHLKNSGGFPAAFKVTGGEASLSGGSGETIKCASVSGTGSYENSTTGTMSLTFHGCKFSIFNCTTHPDPTGTITTTTLPIHNVMLHTNVPGILVTPNAETKTFAHFTCAGINITVEGNGVLGKVTSPACGAAETNKATVDFNATEHGVQEYTQVTTSGTVYNLTKGGEVSAQDAIGTVEFAEPGSIECTH